MDKKILILRGEHYAPFSYNRILDKALRLAGISKEEVEAVDVVGDNGTLYKEASEKIKELDPNVIVTLGDSVTYDMTTKISAQDWRGSILPSNRVSSQRDFKVIPSLAPDWIQRGQFQHFWSLVADLKKAKRQAAFPEIREIPWLNLVSRTAEEAIDYLDSIPNTAPWCIDIETRAGEMACFSVAHDTSAMCFPIQRGDGPVFCASYEAAIWTALHRLMQRNPLMVGQNLTFDLEYLFDYGLEPSGILMDTMISHAINFPEFPKSLAFLTSFYTDMPYHKGEGKNATYEQLYAYNNKDTITTLWCALEIEKQLKARDLWSVHEFVTKELGLALEMQRNHLNVDPVKKLELKDKIDVSMKSLDEKWDKRHNVTMTALANEKPLRPNVYSSLQMREFLYKKLGLPEKTRNHVVVADETAISELRSKHPDIPELGWILDERRLRKLNSSYLDVELEQDGTLAGAWCVHGTETGRWSSGKSPRGRGLNLQTVPKPVRWMIVPPKQTQTEEAK